MCPTKELSDNFVNQTNEHIVTNHLQILHGVKILYYRCKVKISINIIIFQMHLYFEMCFVSLTVIIRSHFIPMLKVLVAKS